ncbi:hypothetical protein [Moraxella cuniculi]|uniref:hypothetical protein n=1 Tax=Moraxella cuniculi TaxID=34061 RepID=UPI00117E0A0E|nr:hypothetical protein [Moraxella cuniculi]
MIMLWQQSNSSAKYGGGGQWRDAVCLEIMLEILSCACYIQQTRWLSSVRQAGLVSFSNLFCYQS